MSVSAEVSRAALTWPTLDLRIIRVLQRCCARGGPHERERRGFPRRPARDRHAALQQRPQRPHGAGQGPRAHHGAPRPRGQDGHLRYEVSLQNFFPTANFNSS